MLDYFMTKVISRQEIFDAADKVVDMEIFVSNNYDSNAVREFKEVYDMIRQNDLELSRKIGVKPCKYSCLEAPDELSFEIEEQECFALSLGFLKQ